MLYIKAKNLTKVYYTPDAITPIIIGQDFTIKPGTLIILTGKSGSGKTTLLKLLMREVLPDYGNIFFNELDITKIPESKLKLIRSHIGVVFQHYRLISYKTVYQNLAFVLDIQGIPQKEQPTVIERLLRLVGLSDKKDYYPSQLSGGEQRRVSIARALATNPSILLADEPTGDLDPKNTEIIINIIRNLLNKNITVIMATHQLELIKRFTDPKIWYMERGRILQDIDEARLKRLYFEPLDYLNKEMTPILEQLPSTIQDKLKKIMPIPLEVLKRFTPKLLKRLLHLTDEEIIIILKVLKQFN